MPAGEVLLIDDDEMILLLAQNVLQEAGYTVVTTADGPQGIEIFRSRRPDVVLLDLGLPSIDGLAVLSKIREMDATARIIVVTGYGSPQMAQEALGLGAAGFLTKPVSSELLLEKVRLAAAG